ncbi:hypothetical protein DICVIV_00318 [Dictyocaulus viviparus]|uniref:Uncharacterized protein n=1 Tax=Dictyocaulus viviparus TaxID=29172 RepID=A0A0D8Y9P3_DICVI|nr:hypothetical protein DICVIV_00318 [Dictyocaulus viviparus]
MIDRKAPLLYEPDVVNQAIRRYETCWLPMQAAHPDMNVIPPLDVHWIWHTHMLSPDLTEYGDFKIYDLLGMKLNLIQQQEKNPKG